VVAALAAVAVRAHCTSIATRAGVAAGAAVVVGAADIGALATVATIATVADRTIGAIDHTDTALALTLAFLINASILILAAGTSYYAALTAKYWIEDIAKIPTSVEIASEYRYRQSVPNPKQLIVTISQSGETLDTMEALKHAKSLGQNLTLAICNVQESAIPRASALVFYTRAGAEIGVASTKAFTTQATGTYNFYTPGTQGTYYVSPAQTVSSTTISGTVTGYVYIGGTNGVVIPAGTTGQRPGSPTTGMIRFNTDSSSQAVEVYTGSQWAGVAGVSAGITVNQATDTSAQWALALG
jgi:hypothetical protein